MSLDTQKAPEVMKEEAKIAVSDDAIVIEEIVPSDDAAFSANMLCTYEY